MHTRYTILLAVTFISFVLLLSRPIQFITSDLGRHITTGRILLTCIHSHPFPDSASCLQHPVLHTNYYSYTQTNFPVINHHWLSGVVFSSLYSLSGFIGLHLFAIAILVMSLILAWDCVRKTVHPSTFLMMTLLSLPLITSRADVRPEIFSYMSIMIFLWICLKHRRFIWTLPIVELFWTNLHIFFPIGIGIILYFWLKDRLSPQGNDIKIPFTTVLLTIGSTLLNPSFVAGATVPFTIFGNYQFAVAENRSLLLVNPTSYPLAWFVYLFIAYSIMQITLSLKRTSIHVIDILFLLSITLFSLSSIRNLPILGFIYITIIPFYIQKINKTSITSICIILYITLCVIHRDLFINPVYGIGLSNESSKLLSYLHKHPLQNPVLNDFDIGGFLIFTQYPSKLFIDNRPEAYPSSFFTKTYIPMQVGSAWQTIDSRYQPQTIIYSKHDASAQAQLFIFTRTSDPKWVIQYEDDSVVLFSRILPKHL